MYFIYVQAIHARENFERMLGKEIHAKQDLMESSTKVGTDY
mgnify:CR=1 FL=1